MRDEDEQSVRLFIPALLFLARLAILAIRYFSGFSWRPWRPFDNAFSAERCPVRKEPSTHSGRTGL
jgi:hypothetical protein